MRLDAQRPLVIVNPRSGAGLSEQRWARLVGEISDGMGEVDSAFTAGPRDATSIARREAEGGRRLIVALGGGGTLSQVADGVLPAGAGPPPRLGGIPPGPGGGLPRPPGPPPPP